MSAIWRSLLRDERGFVITAELVLISTVLVLGLVAALSAVKVAIAGELGDVSNAIGSLNQSFYTHGFHGCGSRVSGSAFLDETDSNDELRADFATAVNTSCTTAVVGTPAAPCNVPPCGAAPCGAPCGPSCATLPAQPYGSPCGAPCQASVGCGVFGVSVPPVICPPGPGPFTGTDAFAPGAISPQNMLLQGISYGGVCADPVAPPAWPAPTIEPQAALPAPPAVEQPCPTPATTSECCDAPALAVPHWEGPAATPFPPFAAPSGGRPGTVY